MAKEANNGIKSRGRTVVENLKEIQRRKLFAGKDVYYAPKGPHNRFPEGKYAIDSHTDSGRVRIVSNRVRENDITQVSPFSLIPLRERYKTV